MFYATVYVFDDFDIAFVCLYVTSKTFGDLTIGFEIGKKEDREGNGSSSTFGEFLKVIQIM